jgi:ribonucleoside-diphosphate reductase alpha chain
MWHLEFESLVVLKNNRGVDENRVRHMDYGVQINKLMYQRLVEGGEITFFSPSDVEGLYDAFFQDQALFEKLYIEAESNPSIRKKKVKAVEAFSWLMNERASTGRIYIQNVDHCNINSPFDENVSPCKQSNLCLEIILPTKPLMNVNDEDGEVALCTLAAFNLGKIESLDDFEELAELIVEALDNLLDYQSYPLPAAYRSTMDRRTLGVGVIDFAHYLAKNGVKYSDGSANNLVHRTFEAMQYYLIKASVKLAKEKGKCPKFDETKWAKGIMPIDRHKAAVDTLHNETLHYDWDNLRKDVVKYGMRNSTLSALMPAETSAQISNSTNGIEPPRGYVSVKASKDGILKQVVPEFEKLKDNYELLWEIPSNKGYLELVSIMQKFVCQSISANTNYDPSRYESGKVPMKQLLQDLLTAYKLGVKTLYYHNTRDGASDTQDEVIIQEDDSCDSGACKI